MSTIFEVRIPKYPECWKSCGNCGSGDISVDDVRVLPGDWVERDETLIVLETGKTTFHWGYVGKALAYAIGYIGAALAMAVLLFEERELS